MIEFVLVVVRGGGGKIIVEEGNVGWDGGEE